MFYQVWARITVSLSSLRPNGVIYIPRCALPSRLALQSIALYGDLYTRQRIEVHWLAVDEWWELLVTYGARHEYK